MCLAQRKSKFLWLLLQVFFLSRPSSQLIPTNQPLEVVDGPKSAPPLIELTWRTQISWPSSRSLQHREPQKHKEQLGGGCCSPRGQVALLLKRATGRLVEAPAVAHKVALPRRIYTKQAQRQRRRQPTKPTCHWRQDCCNRLCRNLSC